MKPSDYWFAKASKKEIDEQKRTPGILTTNSDGKVEYQIINEWQLCPKCNGNGETYANMHSNALIMCDLCNGKKIISKITGNPPK